MARRNVTRGTPPRLARSRNTRSTWASGNGKRTGGGRKASSREDSGGGSDDQNFLGVYFREMSQLDVMSPEQELAAATRIANLRTDYWRAILFYPPFIEGIVGVIADKMDDEDAPTELLATMKKASRNLRDRETRAHKDGYAEAVNALAEFMSFSDVDGIISDLIAADLDMIDAGQSRGLTMDVRPPRKGSRPFKSYVARARRTGASLRFSKNQFVKSNLRLVVSIARRFNHGRMPLQDLIQEGNIGLMKAVDRFDHRKGFRFSTYGSWWIRHAISRAIADKGRAIRLPVHMIDAHHKVTKAKRELETKTGREPSKEEIAAHTGLALSKIEKMDTLLMEQAISLDRPVSEEDGRKVVDFVADEDAPIPGEELEAIALNDQVKQVITGLRPIEADILRKRFGLETDEELTLKEIGEQYSLSRERIRQLQEQALGKIRRELKRREVM